MTTAQPGATQVASLDEMGCPRTVHLQGQGHRRVSPFANAKQISQGALIHSECKSPPPPARPPRDRNGLHSIMAERRCVRCCPRKESGRAATVSFSDGLMELSRAARTSEDEKVIFAVPDVIVSVPG